MSLVLRKPVFGVSDKVRHKPVCTATEGGWRLEISDVEGLYYPSGENKGADQLRGYREADLRLCFRIYAKNRFSHDAAHIIKNTTDTRTVKKPFLQLLYIIQPFS